MLDKLIEQLRGQPLQPFGALVGAEGGVEVVEDVVGAAGEPVQRMDRRALLGGQQPGGEEERPAVLGVQQRGTVGRRPAGPDRAHRRRRVRSGSCLPASDAGRDPAGSTAPVTRSAASRPDIRAVGTPTPGTVDEPASTTLSMPRTVLAGRNGPVWPNVCASANGVPATMPCRAQSAGLTTCSSSASTPSCGSRSADGGHHAVGVGAADARPSRPCPATGSVRAPARRAGRAPRGARRRVARRRPGHQQRRIAHHHAVVDDLAERLLPAVAEKDVVVRQFACPAIGSRRGRRPPTATAAAAAAGAGCGRAADRCRAARW